MDLLMACGTWVRSWSYCGRVVDYILSCDIFPNVRMIVDATGVTEQQARRVLGQVFAQENRYVSRFFLLAELDGEPITGITREDHLIYSYMDRMERRRGLFSSSVRRRFMERHRFYDGDGSIRYRFSEEQVKHALEAHREWLRGDGGQAPP